MKKVFGLLAAAAVLSTSVSFAQSDPLKHEVNVKIPNVLRIRFAQTSANPISAVQFDYADPANLFDIGIPLEPTDANHTWDDIEVFSNKAGWAVKVDVANQGTPFDWSKVSVTRADTTYLSSAAFQLDDAATATITDNNKTAKTGGWQSLGIDPANYRIEFDGSEDEGTYTAEVTYSITATP